MLVVVLSVLLQPPPPLRTDLVVLAEPAQRLFGDPLRHAFDGVIRRRYRHTERFAAAHVGQQAVERAHLGEHRLSPDEALPGEVADDRIEGDQEVLDLGRRETVFGGVFDDRRVEDRLLDRLDGPIQIGNPRGVQRDLDSHRSTQSRQSAGGAAMLRRRNGPPSRQSVLLEGWALTHAGPVRRASRLSGPAPKYAMSSAPPKSPRFFMKLTCCIWAIIGSVTPQNLCM